MALLEEYSNRRIQYIWYVMKNIRFKRSKHCIVWSCKMFVMLLPKLDLILNYTSRSWIFQ